MTKTILKLSAAAVIIGFCAVPAVHAAEALNKSEVEKIIGEYLRANPEVLIESLEGYRAKQEQQQKEASQKNVEQYKDLFADKTLPAAGSDDPDVTVVEFFDYNCGYCRRAVPDIQEVLKGDTKVRFVFFEMPILSENSNEIAKWSLAAHKQGKYFEYHAALMNFSGQRDTATLKKLAKDVGLDADKLEKDAASPEVAAELQKAVGVSRSIGIQGTPAFVINGEMYPGYLGPEGLKQAIAGARQKS